MAIEFVAPSLADAYCGPYYGDFSIFMAGTIEMGNSRNWQRIFAESIRQDVSRTDVILYNPRRFDWDPTWEQTIDNPQFNDQVTWELERLERSDLVIFNFEPGTVSPITLLELGMYIRCPKTKVIVHCPDGYARKGNVEITCKRYGIELASSLEDLIERTKLQINLWAERKNS